MAAEGKGLISELFARRVPQILGVYIGACWLIVEMGEWAAERLGMAPGLVAYVFVLMIALLPSVAVLAWNHGSPGRDRSPRFERVFVPANLVFAVIGVVAFFGYAPPGAPGSAIGPAESATVERTVIDETGEQQTFTVAREGFHRKVLTSFWTLEDDQAAPDWRQYAVAWLLGVELNRDPLISMFTPYSANVGRAYAEAGYAGAVGEPRALAVRQAQRIGARYLVRGALADGEDGVRLTAQIIDATSGSVTDEVEATGADVIEATARLAERIAPRVTPTAADGEQRFTRIPLAEAATASTEALQAAMEGFNALHLRTDYEAAEAGLGRALEIDPTFALAAVWLHQMHRANNNLPASIEALNRAMDLEYKLDSQTRFAMKANRHALAGDYATAMRVLAMWTEVHPDSFTAWTTLAQNQITMGDVEGAAESLRQARALDPGSVDVLRQMAVVEQLAGDYRAAADRLRAYIDEAPDDVAARIELGQVLTRSGQADEALEVFDTAALLADDPAMARLNRALVLLREGRFDDAGTILDALQNSTVDSSIETEVLKVRLGMLASTGRYTAMLEELTASEDRVRRTVPPAQFWNTWAELMLKHHYAFEDYAAAHATLDRAEDALGEPFNRFLALDRMQLLIEQGRPVDEVEAQLERLRFFEQQFSFGGVLAIVQWGNALAAAYAGDTERAVETMREAREQFRASGLSLNMEAMEHFDLALAELLIADGQQAEARRLLDDLLERHPAFASARWERLQLAVSTDRDAAAREDLDVLLAQWSDGDAGFLRLEKARALDATL
ncbi:tetratricopeptide repeat protein [Halomonas denitrificans]|nr:tetratricopeptide repeat protein [Halomonas denitrificans]